MDMTDEDDEHFAKLPADDPQRVRWEAMKTKHIELKAKEAEADAKLTEQVRTREAIAVLRGALDRSACLPKYRRQWRRCLRRS
jgi:hypothetical protein